MANKTQYTHEQANYLCDLFKTVPCEYVSADAYYTGSSRYKASECLEHGFIVVDSDGYVLSIGERVFNIVNDLYGIDPDVMNETFYKSFKTVNDMDRFQIFVDQVIHYFGTYGMEAMGEDPITLVPVQELEVPDVDISEVKVTVIQAADDGYINNLVNDFAANTVAPSKRMTAAFKAFLPLLTLNLNEIRSFELSVMAYDSAGRVPHDGKAFLRYVIYKATGSTLVIKSKRTCALIKAAQEIHSKEIGEMFAKANLVELARIFLRYKPLFLAFKGYEGCAPIINKLRRMADTYHEPLSDNTIQRYIEHALNNNFNICNEIERSMTARDCVKLLNAMLLRINAETGDPAVFNVRNGRSYVKEDAYTALTNTQSKRLWRAIKSVYALLIDEFRKIARGKTFYIPSYIHYAVPHTEKQFLNNFPWGTTIMPPIEVGSPMTVGVSWLNAGDSRVDLDLHAFTPSSHYGWNAEYSSGDAAVVYTGDMTNAPAPNGAAEAYWIQGTDEPVIFNVTQYCGPAIPFKFYLSAVKPSCLGPEFRRTWEDRFEAPYTMDPNELCIPPVPMHIGGEDQRGMVLGYFNKGCFTIYSGNLSNSAVPRGDFKKYIKAIMAQQYHHLNLADILTAAGGTVLDNEEAVQMALDENDKLEVIDLSPEKLTATTLMGLVDGKLP